MFLSWIAAFGSSAFADMSDGNEGSGGGNAVVCQDSSGKILSAELLDLYEYEAPGRTIPPSNKPYLDQALDAAAAIDAGNAMGGTPSNGISSLVKSIQASMKVLSPGIGLKPINDSGQFEIPKTCLVIQTARYQPNNQVFIDGDVWANFSETSKGALLVHEALYFMLRLAGEKTSMRARLAVGYAFAGNHFEDTTSGVPKGAQSCWDHPDGAAMSQWGFYAYPNPAGGTTLQFLVMNGFVMLSKSTIQLPKDSWPYPSTSSYSSWSSTFGILDSLVDSGTGIMVNLAKPGATDLPAGFIPSTIGVIATPMQPPTIQFTCK